MFNILVAEDDKHTSRLMKSILKSAGYEVFCAYNGEEALDILDTQYVDLVIVDIMMPVMDGYELTKEIRDADSNMPILMVTAKQLPEDKKEGFIVGTDDYLVKPISEDILLLRIKALLRRANIVNEKKLTVGDVVLDYDRSTVIRGKKEYPLAQKEFLLLYKLLSYPNKIFTRIQLMDEIWGMECESTDTTVNVHINRLKKKFGDWNEFQIIAIRGIGYKAVITDE